MTEGNEVTNKAISVNVKKMLDNSLKCKDTKKIERGLKINFIVGYTKDKELCNKKYT